MLIEVTQEDIDRGERRSSLCCPIALAMQRELGVPCSVGFGFSGPALLIFPVAMYRTPAPAQDFMAAFDSGKPVQPSVFDFPVCED